MNRYLRLVALLAVALLVGGILTERMGPSERTAVSLPAVPASMAVEISRRFPAADYIVVFGSGACGSPFGAALNYLHAAAIPKVAIVTSTTEFHLLRELTVRSGLVAVADDSTLAAFRPYGNLVIVERATKRGLPLPTYQFDTPTTLELMHALDEIFLGAAIVYRQPTVRVGANQQNLQRG